LLFITAEFRYIGTNTVTAIIAIARKPAIAAQQKCFRLSFITDLNEYFRDKSLQNSVEYRLFPLMLLLQGPISPLDQVISCHIKKMTRKIEANGNDLARSIVSAVLNESDCHTTATGKAFRVTDKEFEMESFCAWDGETLVLNILGKPGSNRDAIGKVKGAQLKVRGKRSQTLKLIFLSDIYATT
jgi:hypothetical protein